MAQDGVPPPFADDPTIGDDEWLLRRVHPRWVVWDDNRKEIVFTSATFDNGLNDEPMSVYLTTTMNELGLAPERALDGHDGCGLARVRTGVVRGEDQAVARDPLDEGHVCDPAHAVVVGTKAPKRRKRIAKQAEWAVPPPSPG